MVKCNVDGCGKRAYYGIVYKEPLTCGIHRIILYNNVVKRSDYENLDIKYKRCEYENCTIEPIFGLPNTKIAKYCVFHKGIDMINVFDKKCTYENCNIRPHYGIPGTKIFLYCNKHKLDGMIKTDRLCQYEDCRGAPRYGLPNTKITKYCNQHKLDGMIDIIKIKHSKFGEKLIH